MFELTSRSVPTVLPPTIGVADPHVRAWMDAMASAWSVRNGGGGPASEQFVRKAEVGDATESAVLRVLSQAFGGPSVAGLPSAPSATGPASLQAAIDEILSSKVVEYLRTPIQQIAASAAGSSDGAGLSEEVDTRSNKDNALAQAINTLWASIGGSDALIQDGALAAVSPAAVVATKWDQVQAAVTDPNTGETNSGSIKQELLLYASDVDDTLNATWGVKIGVNGAASGFSLMTTAGAGSSPGAPTSVFAIMADKLALISPTDESVVPFSVDSSGNAIFTGSLSVTSANAVNTINLGDGIITTPKIVVGAATAAAASDYAIAGTYPGTADTLSYSGIETVFNFVGTGAYVTVHGAADFSCVVGNTAVKFFNFAAELYIDSSLVSSYPIQVAARPVLGGTYGLASVPLLWRGLVAAGGHNYRIQITSEWRDSSGNPVAAGSGASFSGGAYIVAQENKV